MDSNSTVTDPSDWKTTSLPTFYSLESSLRCQICKDFFSNPVITSCSHTFCSLCIRRALSADGKCPLCRTGDQASKLRQNWALEEAVRAFVEARPKALEIATAEERPAKRRRLDTNDGTLESPTSSQRQTRSRARTQQPPQNVVTVLDDDEADEDYAEAKPASQPAPADELVSCPMCQGRMKEEAVYSHLDRCDGTRPSSHKPTPLPLQRAPARPQTPQERLPELSYSLLNDNTMRKKLKELGIPSSGTKAQMIRRHTEWINLWNANCDSSRPKTKRELLHSLDVWERATGASAIAGPNAIMKKDFDAQGYSRSNADDFKRLIEEARKKAKQKPVEPEGNEGSATAEVNGTTTESDPAAEPLKSPEEGKGEALLSQALRGASPPKKVPMFALPSQPVSDIEPTQNEQ